jgi:hypothetical protein
MGPRQLVTQSCFACIAMTKYTIHTYTLVAAEAEQPAEWTMIDASRISPVSPLTMKVGTHIVA